MHPVCVLSVITVVCVGVGLYSENGAMPSDHSKQHMTVCGFSLHLGGWESQKTLKQNLSFKLALLIPTVSMSAFHSINLFLFSRQHIPTNSVGINLNLSLVQILHPF